MNVYHVPKFAASADKRSSSVRVIVNVLLAFLTVGQWLPFLVPPPEAALPACCRANGSHHCAVKAMVSPQQSPGARAVSTPCRFYPAQAYSTQGHAAAGITTSQAYFCQLVSHPAIHAQVDARFRVSFDRSRQKRGPPCLNLS